MEEGKFSNTADELLKAWWAFKHKPFPRAPQPIGDESAISAQVRLMREQADMLEEEEKLMTSIKSYIEGS